MLINGRKFIGNAPTLVAGPSTKMRFGVVGMNDMMFHTFHLHGHRCHVLGHMHSTLGGGMMGSLLVIQGGESAFGPHFGLPLGEPCHGAVQPPDPVLTANVRSTAGCQWRDDTSGTPETTIKVNGTVTWFDNGCSRIRLSAKTCRASPTGPRR